MKSYEINSAYQKIVIKNENSSCRVEKNCSSYVQQRKNMENA